MMNKITKRKLMKINMINMTNLMGMYRFGLQKKK